MSNKLPRTPMPELEPSVRAKNFEEVAIGYSESDATTEASRCIQCKKPHCVEACPVNIQIPQFLLAAREQKFAEALSIINQDNLFPAVCGRVCPQETQCEGVCILGKKGEAVAIGRVERFLADWAMQNNHKTKFSKESDNGKKVAVIGSGPAGLACASDLARYGYDVTIFEALHKVGGVLEYGIPEFRLPKEKVLKKEIQNVLDLGVKIETDIVVGRTVSVDDLLKKEHFDAIFLGTGAGLPKFMGIPGENLNGVFSANEYLTRANLMKGYQPTYHTPIFEAQHVVVIGGGNVAMDAARTALRVGAKVSIVYRRSEAELPARLEEVHHAKEEGIEFLMLTNPVAVLGNEQGQVIGLRCVKMELGEPDDSGRRSPKVITNSEFDITADAVIMAIGTSPNPIIAQTTQGLETNKYGCIIADENGQTSREYIFAGGDTVTGAATVILAMGTGRKAAQSIHQLLSKC